MSIGGEFADIAVSGPVLLAAPVAAIAGLASFLSPCVLPLVPGYLSYVTGLSGRCLDEAGSDGQRRTGRDRRRLLAGSGLFVLGFSVVFVSYGAAFGDVGRLLRLHEVGLDRALGGVTIVLGLAFAGLLAWLPVGQREYRVHRLPAAGLWGAPLLGVLFGLGWTPCIGPTLAAVLGLAADAATAGRGAALAFAYCLGLGVPFVLTAFGLRRALGLFATIRRHSRAVMALGGGLLVLTGLLEVTGVWQGLVAILQHDFVGYAAPI